MGTQPQNYIKCIARLVCRTTEGYNYARSYGNVKSWCIVVPLLTFVSSLACTSSVASSYYDEMKIIMW